MDKRVWMGMDLGSSGEGWLWGMGWVREGLSGFVEMVDQVRGGGIGGFEGAGAGVGSRSVDVDGAGE